MDNIGRNYSLPSGRPQGGDSGKVGDNILASLSTTGNTSEVGRIAKDFAPIFDKWGSALHRALQSWYSDEGSLNNLLNTAKTVVSEVKLFWSWYETGEKDGENIIFPPGYITQLKSVMTLLGVPPSQINVGSLEQSGSKAGWYNLTTGDIKEDCRLMIQYAMKDYSGYIAKYGNPQQEVTKDMLFVMYDVTSLHSNQKSVASIFATLKKIAQTITQNVAS